MTLDFKVTYRGEVPGLSSHRLSMGAFGKALERLTVALQRTASGLVSGQSSGRGRIAEEARALDFELVRLEDNCVSLHMNCVDRHFAQLTMDATLAERALAKLTQDISGEYDGAFQNAAVRRYLEELPLGLSEQQYRVFKDGILIHDVHCGGPLARVEQHESRLVKLRGQIVAVGFPPGPTYVSLKSGDAKPIRLLCAEAQLSKALELRGQEVQAAVLLQSESRLLWVRNGDDDVRPAVHASVKYLQSNWVRTLDLLAQ